MKKLLLVAAIALGLAISLAGTAAAQAVQYGTEVCVNASEEATARRLFPNARLHVIPDFVDSEMNGWRFVSGPVGAGGKIMTDAEEIRLRQRERNTGRAIE